MPINFNIPQQLLHLNMNIPIYIIIHICMHAFFPPLIQSQNHIGKVSIIKIFIKKKRKENTARAIENLDQDCTYIPFSHYTPRHNL